MSLIQQFRILAMAKITLLKEKPITEDTIKLMSEMVRKYYRHPDIITLVRRIMAETQKALEGRREKMGKWDRASSIVSFVYHNVGYVNDPYKTELVESPLQVWKMRAADCDGHTTFTCTLLRAAGYNCGFRTVSTKPNRKFNHVYGYVYIFGMKVPFDTTRSPKLGYDPEEEYEFTAIKDWEV